MTDKERLQGGPEGFNEAALSKQGAEQAEKLRDDRERAAEKSHEGDVDSARHEVENAAVHEIEPAPHEAAQETSRAERRGPASKRERAASYDRTMQEVRSQMSAPSRTFSAIIHNPVVEKTSDVVGNTIARPNAILSGALFAFIFTLAIYLMARFNGYPLSGTESIASFAGGWILGIIFDYFRLLIVGKQ
jgi:hypothetical protein